MQGYKIADLREDVRLTIKQQHLDKNGDGRINEENGELAALLSKTGSSDIQGLADRDTDNDLMNGLMLLGTVGAGAAMGIMGNHCLIEAEKPLTSEQIAKGVKTKQLLNRPIKTLPNSCIYNLQPIFRTNIYKLLWIQYWMWM